MTRLSGAGCGESRTSRSKREVRGIIAPIDPTQQKWIYTLSMVLMGSLVAGLGAGLIFGMIYAKVRSDAYLIQVLACALIGALIFFNLAKDPIEPVENISFWSYKRLKDNLFFGLRIGLIAGLIFGLASWAALSLIYQRPVLRIMDLISAGLVGLDAGLILALIRSVKGGTIGTSIMCNQGIWQSGKNAVILMVMAGITWGIMAKVIIGIPMISGVIAGIVMGIFSPAGMACIKHVILRIILYCNRNNPWNYARFLDYATQLIFLQKVGGGYIFIHRLLLEHFAEIKL